MMTLDNCFFFFCNVVKLNSKNRHEACNLHMTCVRSPVPIKMSLSSLETSRRKTDVTSSTSSITILMLCSHWAQNYMWITCKENVKTGLDANSCRASS